MKKHSKMSAVLALAICLSCLAGIAGCGSKTPSASASASAASGGDMANTLVYAGENVDTINPVLSGHGELAGIIFSGLMKYDKDGKPVTDLAESESYDEASLTYTFKLRQNVKWHDGKPFTSADVVYTYQELTSDTTLDSSLLSDYTDIDSVAAPDDYTFTVKMKQYNAAMLDYFTIGIIPKHLLEGKDVTTDSFNQTPVGTGRYKFVSWDTAGGAITLEANADYYDKVPQIKTVIYKTVATESTKATMLQSGEADLAWLNAKYAEEFRGKDGFTNTDFKTADYRAVAMDFRTDFWKQNKDSVAVLNYAVDKDAIVKSVLTNQGFKAYSPIQINAYGGDTKADIYTYDLNKFAAEMQKLGWTKGSDGIYARNGQKFSFTIQVRDYEEERVDIANIVSKQLKEAGVDMQIKLVTKFDWKAGYNGFLAGYAVEFDPDGAYKQFTTDGSDNTMKYSDTKVDEILTNARHEKDAGARKTLYGQFEEAFAADPASVLIAYLNGNYVSVSGLKGLDTTRTLGHHAVGVMWNIEDWTITR